MTEQQTHKLLKLLEEDCTTPLEHLAALAGISMEEAAAARQAMEADRRIVGYQAIIDWDRTHGESVTALIEVKLVPQRDAGFDRIAERIYNYDEVESLYLMSGAYDLAVTISGRTLKEVASFVSQRLSTIEGVTSTATHFILKKYKEKHRLFEPQPKQDEEWIFS